LADVIRVQLAVGKGHGIRLTDVDSPDAVKMWFIRMQSELAIQSKALFAGVPSGVAASFRHAFCLFGWIEDLSLINQGYRVLVRHITESTRATFIRVPFSLPLSARVLVTLRNRVLEAGTALERLSALHDLSFLCYMMVLPPRSSDVAMTLADFEISSPPGTKSKRFIWLRQCAAKTNRLKDLRPKIWQLEEDRESPFDAYHWFLQYDKAKRSFSTGGFNTASFMWWPRLHTSSWTLRMKSIDQSINTSIRSIVKALGVENADGLSAHSLRKTVVSTMITGGIRPEVVRDVAFWVAGSPMPDTYAKDAPMLLAGSTPATAGEAPNVYMARVLRHHCQNFTA